MDATNAKRPLLVGYIQRAMELLHNCHLDISLDLACGTGAMPRQWQEYTEEYIRNNPTSAPPIGVMLRSPGTRGGTRPDPRQYLNRLTNALLQDVPLRAMALELAAAGFSPTILMLIGAAEVAFLPGLNSAYAVKQIDRASLSAWGTPVVMGVTGTIIQATDVVSARSDRFCLMP